MRAVTRHWRLSFIALAGLLPLVIVSIRVSPATGQSPATPAFVQQVSSHKLSVSSLALVPTANVTTGNRLIVEVGIWNGSHATAASVKDSAGNTYAELLHFQAGDGTDMSVWSAPITSGGATKPTITVKPTSTADTGAVALEYSGLSSAADATAVDVMSHASGTTGAAALVSSGSTPPATAGNELSLGLYVDSGFGDTLSSGAGYTQRANVGPDGDIELLAEDSIVAAGGTPNASVRAGANTTWLMANLVFKAASTTPPTAPSAPTGVGAVAGNNSATVSWTAPASGGSPITSYTVTPYINSAPQTSTTVTGTPPATTASITGLTNGTAYTFTVTATNAIGTGPSSNQSNTVTPAPPPPGPTIDPSTPAINTVAPNVTTIASNSFSPPAGTIIYVAFAVDSDPSITNAHVASVTNSGSALTWHLKGAENHPGPGVGAYVEVWWAYNPAAQTNITVTANLAQPTKNVTPPIGAVDVVVFDGAAQDQTSAAWSPAYDSGTGSLPSATVTTTAPNSMVLGVANNWDSSVTPTVPAGQTTTINGQSAVVLNPTDQDTYWVQALTSPAANPGPITINDTAPSVRYHEIAWEVTASGSSTPVAPSAPTGVSATAGNGSATVSWTAPYNGGSPITSYTVTPYIGNTPQTPTTVTGSPPSTSANVTGLSNGVAYTFTVTATNNVGTGPPSSPSNSVTPGARPGGQWSSVMSWPMVAIHSVLLKNGNVLQFDGWQQPEPTQVWNPSTQTFTNQTAPDSIFCSGVTQLPDGRVLVVGGYGGLSTGQIGIVDTTIFDPSTSTWSRVADMHSPRWYPDLTELADGRYVAISGNSTNSSTWADTPEVYDPTSNTWTTLSNVSTSQVHEEEYPFSYLLPSGNVFTIGPSEDKSFLLSVGSQTWTQTGGASGVLNGSSVMYRPGKVLYSGGTNTQTSSSPANATTAVIDLTASTPTWTQTAPMNYPRVYHTLTMLPDGTVLAVGGEPTWGQTGTTETTGGVLPSEIWNPTTQTWSVVASTGVTRGYHSTAILMPDGTVLVAGSGHANPGYPGQNSAQIYSPPYLFNGPRPVITSAPGAASYGSTIPVSTPNDASISAVNLVSLGADTHQSDMNQHFVPLSFSQASGGLNVQMPTSGAVAPPGNYMLFIVNSNGVPSVASIINVAASVTAPSAPSNVLAAAGNGTATVSWGAPFNGGSPITSYTVTPYVGSTAQTPTTVAGSPPGTNTTITGLTNGTTYTFTVTATNGVGTSPPSAPSNAVTPTNSAPPAYVQSASAHASSVGSLSVTPSSNIATGNRLVVETGVWNSSNATMASVTDSAGNKYVELLHYAASDGTEISVWTAPVTAGAGTRPTIIAKPTSTADVGVAALEYSGLSAVTDATIVDQMAHSSGTTNGAGSVASGATAASTSGNELALGFYADSGFGDTLSGGSGYTSRVNVSNTPNMELLAEDQPLPSAGTTANASVGTGPQTTWLMATLVLKSAPGTAAPSRVASARARSLTRSTRQLRATSKAAWRPTHPLLQCSKRSAASRSSACRSLRRAARITAAARDRFIYEALLKHLPASLFCVHTRSTASNVLSAWWYKPGSA